MFWGGNKVFRVQGKPRKPFGTISWHFEAILKKSKKSWIFDFFSLKVKEFSKDLGNFEQKKKLKTFFSKTTK